MIEGFGPAVEWVRSFGVEAQPAVDVLRFGRGHQTLILNYLRACELALRECNGREIVIPAETRRLLVEEGSVRGAEIATPSGETRAIRARSTLLATGGFQADPDLRETLIDPLARGIPLRSNPYSSGDGLRLAREAGAAFGPDDAGFYGHLMPSGITFGENEDFPAFTLYYSEHGVLVDQRQIDVPQIQCFATLGRTHTVSRPPQQSPSLSLTSMHLTRSPVATPHPLLHSSPL